ncbi:MAG: FAD binding domain-containing protein [Phycisphaerae bacterium]
MNAFEYLMPQTFDAALALLADGKPGKLLVKAGGIDVVDRLRERLEAPPRVLSLRQIRDADPPIGIRADKTVAIHALATLAQLAANETLRERYPAIAEAAGDAATPAVRNVATVGGNLCQKPRCWYYRSNDFHCLKKGGSTCYAVEGDNRYHAILGAGACHIVHASNLAIVLMAHGASLRIVKHDGDKTTERIVPIDEFYRVPASPQDDEHALEPGELVREVILPAAGSGPKSWYLTVKEKESFDWPLVACAANVNDAANPRVVLGAVAPIPWRLKAIEQLVAGKAIDDGLLDQVRTRASQGAKPMSRNGYKVQLVGVIVERALREAAART